MKKVLLLPDHYKKDYFINQNGKAVSNYGNTQDHYYLAQIINYLGIKDNSVVKFLYPKIPTKVPTKRQMTPYTNEIKDFIKKNHIDIVLGFGSLVNREILGGLKDNKLHDIEIDDYKLKGAIYPNLTDSPDMPLSDNQRDNFYITTHYVKRYLKDGDYGLEFHINDTYKYVTDFSEVKTIFEDILPKQNILAVDFETNTLKTYLPKAKAIMISLSWGTVNNMHNIAIPLEYRDLDLWTKEEFKAIKTYIKELFERDQYKVLHNAKFDVRMLYDLYDLKHARKVLDTMIMYYVAVSETGVKNLKHLAAKYTDFGGYEDSRDEYFNNLLDEDKQQWIKKEQGRLNKEAEQTGKKPKKVKVSDYKPPINEVDGTKSPSFEMLPIKILYPYAAADTNVTLLLFYKFLPLVKKNPKWKSLVFNYYPQLSNVLCKIEHDGMHIDTDLLNTYSVKYDEIQHELLEKMYKEVPELHEYEQERLDNIKKRKELMATVKPADRTEKQKAFIKEVGKYASGEDSNGIPKYKFSPTSGEKIAYVLFELLGYEVPLEKDYIKPAAINKGLLNNPEKLTYKDFKTDSKTVLPYLKKTYGGEFVDLLLQYAKVGKLKTAFVDAFQEVQYDSLIHGTFNPIGTHTGRMSSSNPNLQQLAKKTHNINDLTYNYPIKGLFKSRFKNGIMVNLDYKSLEVFIASLIGKDTGMTKALLDGADIHKRNASIAFNEPLDQVTKDHRQKAKSVTFGTMYGQSAMAFAEMWNETVDEAQKTVDKVLNAMVGVKNSREHIIEFCKKYGFVETLFGNYRRLPQAKSTNKYTQARAIRQSYNSVVQGSGSFLTGYSLILINDYIEKNHLKSKLIATVHDSLVIDMYPTEFYQLSHVAKYIMENLPISFLKCSNKEFNLAQADIPKQYQLDNEHFKFPFTSEISIGLTYADDLDFEEEEYQEFGKNINKYLSYLREVSELDDIYADKLGKTKDSDVKDALVKQENQEIEKIKQKYLKK